MRYFLWLALLPLLTAIGGLFASGWSATNLIAVFGGYTIWLLVATAILGRSPG